MGVDDELEAVAQRSTKGIGGWRRSTGGWCHGVCVNHAGERRTLEQGSNVGMGFGGGGWPDGLQVAGEEAGRLRVQPVKNKKNFEIRLRIFQTTQNMKISKRIS
jgi:hypothetical protein